jgi:hypothetical protein
MVVESVAELVIELKKDLEILKRAIEMTKQRWENMKREREKEKKSWWTKIFRS